MSPLLLQLAVPLLLLTASAAGDCPQPALVSALSRACLEGTSHSLAILELRRGQLETVRELKSSQQLMQQQLRALQEQLALRTQEQLAALQQQLSALRPAEPHCPPGWSRHETSCYLLPVHPRASWLQAHRLCATLHHSARLASVHADSREHVEALIAASDAERVWVGLTRVDADTWAWTDGSPLDYTGWAAEEPNDLPKPSNCAQVNGPRYSGRRGWNDYDCYAKAHVLCQIDLE